VPEGAPVPDPPLIEFGNRGVAGPVALPGDDVGAIAADAEVFADCGPEWLTVVATMGAVTRAAARTPAATLVARFHVCGCVSTTVA
jgi:hypothetical protein